MKLVSLQILLWGAVVAQAAPVQLRNCKSDIVTEVFTECPDGEGGANIPCGSKKTKWGSVVANMTVDSQSKTTRANLVYTSVNGRVTSAATNCALNANNWMECTTQSSVSELGKLMITFNIDGIAPGVYFADIFADATNVPVGGFQSTETDCEK